jgi:hypothetical protein
MVLPLASLIRVRHFSADLRFPRTLDSAGSDTVAEDVGMEWLDMLVRSIRSAQSKQFRKP